MSGVWKRPAEGTISAALKEQGLRHVLYWALMDKKDYTAS